jgi:hypothetical protein
LADPGSGIPSSDPEIDINASSPHLNYSSGFFSHTYTRPLPCHLSSFFLLLLLLVLLNCLILYYEFVVFVRTHSDHNVILGGGKDRTTSAPQQIFDAQLSKKLLQKIPKCLAHIIQIMLGLVHLFHITGLGAMAVIPVSKCAPWLYLILPVRQIINLLKEANNSIR